MRPVRRRLAGYKRLGRAELWLLRRPTARFQVAVAEHLAVVAVVVLDWSSTSIVSRGVAARAYRGDDVLLQPQSETTRTRRSELGLWQSCTK